VTVLTVGPLVRDKDGVSVYSVKGIVRLSVLWSYKVRAIHSDDDHARTVSAFSRAMQF
jgi:hypothetical protein